MAGEMDSELCVCGGGSGQRMGELAVWVSSGVYCYSPLSVAAEAGGAAPSHRWGLGQ